MTDAPSTVLMSMDVSQVQISSNGSSMVKPALIRPRDFPAVFWGYRASGTSLQTNN